MALAGKKFSIFANIVLVILCLSCVLPLLLLIVSSVTSEAALNQNGYAFWPAEFGLDAYKYLWHSRNQILTAYGMTFLTTLCGTTLNVTITTLLAYPLSRRTLPGRNFFSFVVFFTLLFNGGMIPSYLTWTQMFHIKDTFWALIFPNLLMNGFGVIVMRTYFSTSIPYEIIEAARIDGAGEMRTLAAIVLPLSKPILSTTALLSGLAYWNDWINGLYYLSARNGAKYYTIQIVLNNINDDISALVQAQTSGNMSANVSVPSITIRMAIAVVGILPILVAYPFFQRYFVKGITLGAVKE